MRKVTHARERNPWADRDELLDSTGVGVHDVITSANFYDCRLWGLSVVGVKFWVFPLTRVVALTTLLIQKTLKVLSLLRPIVQ